MANQFSRRLVNNECGHDGQSVGGMCRNCRHNYWYANDPARRARIKARVRVYNKQEYVKNRLRVSENYRTRFTTTKDAVLSHYGKHCACCGECEPQFLTIDHANNDGAAHRREIGGKTGYNFYRWLIRNRFPSGFRTFCYNCNCGSARNGGVCPHEVARAARQSA